MITTYFEVFGVAIGRSLGRKSLIKLVPTMIDSLCRIGMYCRVKDNTSNHTQNKKDILVNSLDAMRVGIDYQPARERCCMYGGLRVMCCQAQGDGDHLV